MKYILKIVNFQAVSRMSEENPDQSTSDSKLPKKKWVKFEDDVKAESEDSSKPAVLPSESVQVNVPTSSQKSGTYSGAILPTESVHINVNHIRSADANNSNSSSQVIDMRTINLHETSNGVSSAQSTNVIRQGFGKKLLCNSI